MSEVTEAQLDELIAELPVAPKPTHLGGPGPKPPTKMSAEPKIDALSLTPKEILTGDLRAGYAACIAAKLGGATYTEGSERWYGITHQCDPWEKANRHPLYADCSAFATWCLWIATRQWGLADFVNGCAWTAGFTGTMVEHGAAVELGHLRHGDCVFYGGTPEVPQHTAIFVGKGRVVSMGEQGDPRLYPTDLYEVLPIVQCRRFIR